MAILGAIDERQIDWIITTRDEDGSTPLHRAAYAGHWDSFDTISQAVGEKQKIESIQAKENDEWTSLYVATWGGHLGVIGNIFKDSNEQQKIELLLAKANDGWTPLHVAARRRHLEHIKVILSAVDGEQRKKLMTAITIGPGSTPLQLAAERINYLLSNSSWTLVPQLIRRTSSVELPFTELLDMSRLMAQSRNYWDRKLI